MWHQEDQLLLEATTDTRSRRVMWCDSCKEFTQHTIEYRGTEGVARHFIVKLQRICQHQIKTSKRGENGRFLKSVCGEVTDQYMRQRDWNALITNDYWE